MGMTASERGTASGYWHQAWCYIPKSNPSLVPSSKKPCYPTAQGNAQPQEPCTGVSPKGISMGKQ